MQKHHPASFKTGRVFDHFSQHAFNRLASIDRIAEYAG